MNDVPMGQWDVTGCHVSPFFVGREKFSSGLYLSTVCPEKLFYVDPIWKALITAYSSPSAKFRDSLRRLSTTSDHRDLHG